MKSLAISDRDEKVKYFRTYVIKIDAFYRIVLSQFISFVFLLSQQSAINKMTPSRLAEFLYPIVVRPKWSMYYMDGN